MSKLERAVLRNAGHIKQPYTLDEILDQIESDNYSADLMLQHLLLYIAMRENNA